jgi:hypothetical protein
MSLAGGAVHRPIPHTSEATTGILFSTFFWLLIHILAVSGAFSDPATPLPLIGATARAIIGAMVIALLASMAFKTLSRNGWSTALAALMVVIGLGNAAILYGVTVDGEWIPMVAAIALVVPAIHSSETVGDVQTMIAFGLSLALLSVVGVEALPLIPPLAIFGALMDRDGRSNPRAFLSLILVLILPAFIFAMTAVLLARSGLTVPYLSADYWDALLHGDGTPEPWRALFALVPMWPFAASLVAAFVLQTGRRNYASLIAALLLPLYLVIGQQVFRWSIPDWMPPATLLVCGYALAGLWRLTWFAKGVLIAGISLTVLWSWTIAGAMYPADWRSAVARPLSTLLLAISHPTPASLPDALIKRYR